MSGVGKRRVESGVEGLTWPSRESREGKMPPKLAVHFEYESSF